jgi:hypothetical protein
MSGPQEPQQDHGDGIPIALVIAGYYGITAEQGEEYWNSLSAETQKARPELPHPRPENTE